MGGPSLSRVISADRIGMDRMIADDFADSPALGWLWLLGCLLILIDPWTCWTWHLETFKTQFPCSQSPSLKFGPQDRAISGYQRLSPSSTHFLQYMYTIILILQNKHNHALHSPHITTCTTLYYTIKMIKLAQWSSIKRSNFRRLICRRPRHTETKSPDFRRTLQWQQRHMTCGALRCPGWTLEDYGSKMKGKRSFI